jgi:hypothetical protein
MNSAIPLRALTRVEDGLCLVASVMRTCGLTQRFPNNRGQDFPDFIDYKDFTPKGE